jgi:hypothetical protein
MSVLSAAHVAAHHPSAWGAAIVPALMFLMAGPPAIAAGLFGWGRDDA